MVLRRGAAARGGTEYSSRPCAVDRCAGLSGVSVPLARVALRNRVFSGSSWHAVVEDAGTFWACQALLMSSNNAVAGVGVDVLGGVFSGVRGARGCFEYVPS